MHALVISVTTALALWWLARSLGLWIWFLPVPLLSPYFWFYSRVLWDNPFLLPLGALALAGYAAFLATRSPAGLRVSWGALLAIPLVHLMGVALVLPLVAHMLIVHWRDLWRHRWSLATMVGVALFVAGPYWRYLLGPWPSSPPGDGSAAGWLFPLVGARTLTSGGIDYFYGSQPVSERLFTVTASVSAIAYGLVWSGIALAVFAAGRAALLKMWTPRAHIASIAVGVLPTQSIIDGISSRYQHTYYQNGTWIVTVLLAWLAVDTVSAFRRVGRPASGLATAALAGALALAVAGLAIGLRQSGGTREVYGPTLANQLEVARALGGYDPASNIEINVSMWERFPHTPAVLRELSQRRQAGLPQRRLLVRYASADPASRVIELVER
jgi:hypothetical protein